MNSTILFFSQSPFRFSLNTEFNFPQVSFCVITSKVFSKALDRKLFFAIVFIFSCLVVLLHLYDILVDSSDLFLYRDL